MRVALPYSRSAGRPVAFTLIELLVVISIIGILAAAGLPALKGFSKSDSVTAADRQMLDDIANARQLAIANHTDVYMLFMPPTNVTTFPTALLNDPVAGPIVTNLLTMEYTGYALYSDRSVGDQPGQSSPQYLTPWRRLPAGMFIAASKFNQFQSNNSADGWVSAFQYQSFPFPVVTSNTIIAKNQISLPYIQFNYMGQLMFARDNYSSSEIIPLARGSVLTNPPGAIFPTLPVDVLEVPPNNSTNTLYNHVYIDLLTGRGRVKEQQIQ